MSDARWLGRERYCSARTSGVTFSLTHAKEAVRVIRAAHPLLGEFILRRQHEVVGLETGFCRTAWLFDDRRDRPRSPTRDIRKVRPEDLAGLDALVHPAELLTIRSGL